MICCSSCDVTHVSPPAPDFDGTSIGELALAPSFHKEQKLFEEDPVRGMALLVFDQTNVICHSHSQHCMKYVEGGTGGWVHAATQRSFVYLQVNSGDSEPRLKIEKGLW